MNKQKIRLSFLLLGLLFSFAVKAVDLATVTRSMNAFKTYTSYMNNAENVAGVEVEFIMSFLSNKQEADGEAHDAFDLNILANKEKLKKFAGHVYLKEMKSINEIKNQKVYLREMQAANARYRELKQIDRVVFASIGSSSTQFYYLKDGKRVSHFLPLGSTDSKGRADKVDSMLAVLNKLKRPVIFFNAIAFVNPKTDKKLKGYHICDLNNPHLTFLEQKLTKDGKVSMKDGQPEVDSGGVLANMLAERIRRDNKFAAYIFKTANKADKFSNKWTNSKAKEFFGEDEVGLMCDNGGSGFSLREVNKQKIDTEGTDLVEILKAKDWDQFKNQKDIVAYYAAGPEDANIIHETLYGNKGKMKEVIALWIEKNRDKIKNNKLKVVLFQTGQLRELFFNNAEFLKNVDGESKDEGRAKKPEEKKGEAAPAPKAEPKPEAPKPATPAPAQDKSGSGVKWKQGAKLTVL